MRFTIEVPDDHGWVIASTGALPEDGELCVVVGKYGDKNPEIMQFRKADDLHPGKDYFLCLAEAWLFSDHEMIDEWEPTFLAMDAALLWKPLNLPPAIDIEMQRQIRTWFEEEEDEGD